METDVFHRSMRFLWYKNGQYLHNQTPSLTETDEYIRIKADQPQAAACTIGALCGAHENWKIGDTRMESSIIRKNGELTISINGKPYPPLSFKSFRANPRNVSEFYRAGVRLFSVLSSGITSALGVPYSLYGESWVGEYEYDFTPLDRQLDMFMENAPDAYFAPMVQIDTRGWYLKNHPDAPNSFTHLSQIAGDAHFRHTAAAYMKAFIRHCEEKYGDRIYGYFLLGGTTTEWFSDRDYEAPHPIKEQAYRAWCGDEAACLPSVEALNRQGGIFLDSSEAEIASFRRFHAELIADLVLYFAKEAQSILCHKKLLGLYFGYLFELGAPRLHNAGHLAYEKIFMSPDIQMIASPASYGSRTQFDPGAFMVTQKSLDAHNKLYFLEFDHCTHTVPEMIDEPISDDNGNLLMDKFRVPGMNNKCRNEEESLNLLYREFILSKASGAALWWFDMFDGWFRSDAMMRAVSRMLDIDRQMDGYDKHSIAEIAVFAEGESMYRVRKSSPIATDCLLKILRTLAESGAPYDLYTISDIRLPEISRYTFYIFVNAYDIPDSEKEKIRQVCARSGKTILWLYAPDYAHNGNTDTAHITAVTGIPVTESDAPHGAFVYEDTRTAGCTCAPYFSVPTSGAKPLAYWEDGTVAAAETVLPDSDEKNSGILPGCRSIYAAAYRLPSAFLRNLLQESKVFVYSEAADVFTYTNSAFLGVYRAGEGDAVLHVREDGSYRDLITGEVFSAENGILVLPQRPMRAYFLVLYPPCAK